MNGDEGDNGDQKARENENRGGEKERRNEELRDDQRNRDQTRCPCSDITVASACPSIPQLGKTFSSDRGG